MGAKRVFIDTNILFYAHDSDAGVKHSRAIELVESAWERQVYPVISVQVLQELIHNLRRRLRDDGLAVSIVHDYLVWAVVPSDVGLFESGLRFLREYKVSLWDAMIIAAANRGKAEELWTEDLNTGQKYGAVLAVNPFVSSAP